MRARPSAQRESLELAVGAPGIQDLEEAQRAGAVHVREEAVPVPLGALAIVVAGRALPVEALTYPRQAAHFLYVGLFGLGGRLQHACTPCARFADHVRDVPRLLAQCLGHVDRVARLREAEEEAIRKAMRGQAVQRAQARRPMLRQRLTAAADDVVAGTA